MTTSSRIIKASGDIGFLWIKQHPSFFWAPGHYTLLNQKFIDDYQLLQLGYGRIISRGKSFIKVEFLKPYPGMAYTKGQIIGLKPEVLEEYPLVSGNYVRFFPEELPLVKVIAEKDKVNARMLKPGGNRSEHEGSIIRISIDEAERLLEGKFIEILPYGYKDPIPPEKAEFKASDYLTMECKNVSPEDGVAPGTFTLIHKSRAKKLMEKGFFDLVTTGKERAKILVELGFQQDPYTKKLIK